MRHVRPDLQRRLSIFLVITILFSSFAFGLLPSNVEAISPPKPIQIVSGTGGTNFNSGQQSYYFGAALAEDYTVWAWGNNEYDQAGAGADTLIVPKQVSGLPAIDALAAGGAFTLALDQSNQVWIWGTMVLPEWNGTVFPDYQFPVPQLVTGGDGTQLSNITKIAAGETIGYMLTVTGDVYSFGKENYMNTGSLGQGTVTESVYALPIGIDGTVTDIAAGRGAVYAVTDDYKLFGWGGFEFYNELACPTSCYPATAPIEIQFPEGTEVYRVWASSLSNSAFALTSDGIYAWGENGSGQLGLGTNGSAPASPQKVLGIDGSSVRDIALGLDHTTILMNDGTLYGTGYNRYDNIVQDGDIIYTSFTRITSIEDVDHIFAAESAYFAIKQDGTAWAWGRNQSKQAGYNYTYGLLGTGEGSEIQIGTPEPMLALQTYPADYFPAVDTLSVEPYGDFGEALDIDLTLPRPMVYDTIYFEVLDFDTNAVLYSDTSWLSFPSTITETLPNGKYKISVQLYDSVRNISAAPVVFDNGGAGYVIDYEMPTYTLIVKDKETKLPVANAEVYLGNWSEVEEESGSEPQYTDNNGTVVFSDLFPRNGYSLDIYAEGYAPLESDSFPIHSSRTDTVFLVPEDEPDGLKFEDEDDRLGFISGSIYWYPPYTGEDAYTEYRFYFRDADGNLLDADDDTAPIDPIVIEPVKIAYTNYYADIAGIEVPTGAEEIIIHMYNGVTEKQTIAYLSLWDAPYVQPSGARMIDSNPEEGTIEGSVTWSKPSDDSRISAFAITDEYDDILGVVDKYDEPYAFPLQTISNVAEEEDFSLLGVSFIGNDGNVVPGFSPVFFVDDMSGSPVPESYSTSSSVVKPTEISFENVTLENGTISGLLQWTVEGGDNTATDLYFLDASGQLVQPIARIFNEAYSGTYDTFSYLFTDVAMPANSVQIGIFARDYSLLSEPTTVGLGTVSRLVENSRGVDLTQIGSTFHLQVDPSIQNLDIEVQTGTADNLVTSFLAVTGGTMTTSNTETTLSIDALPMGASEYEFTVESVVSGASTTSQLFVHRTRAALDQPANIMSASVVSDGEIEIILSEPIFPGLEIVPGKFHLDGDGVEFSIDTITVSPDRRVLTFASNTASLPEGAEIELNLSSGAFYFVGEQLPSIAAIGRPVLTLADLDSKRNNLDIDGDDRFDLNDLIAAGKQQADQNGDGVFDKSDVTFLLRLIQPHYLQ